VTQSEQDPAAGRMKDLEDPLHGSQHSRLPEKQRVRVMVVDPFVMIREGLAVLVDQQLDLLVVGHSDSPSSAKALGVSADVILANMDLPETRYIDLVTEIRVEFPTSRILALSMFHHPAMVQDVLASGADGYILKTAPSNELFTGIRALAREETYLQPSLGVEFAIWSSTESASVALSPKEERVLYLLALGNTNAEIARGSHVSLRTVESHRSRIYQKLGIRTRAELVQYARKVGLLGESPRE